MSLEVPLPESRPTVKIKRTSFADAAPPTPMGPPPVPPQRKISIAVPSKKRARDVDDILGDEVDAILPPSKTKIKVKEESQAPPAAATSISISSKKARRSPEKQSPAPAPAPPAKKRERDLNAYLDEPGETPPAPSPASVSSAPVNPFVGQPAPSQSAVNFPFRAKRAKQLITLLQKEPSAALVSLHPYLVINHCADIPSSYALSMRSWMVVRRMCHVKRCFGVRADWNRYYKEIKKPRDFGTIAKKVDGKEGKKYTTMQQFGEDIELVFAK